jgi:hypothetical protein
VEEEIRRCRRSCGETPDAGCGAGSGERGPEAVAAEALEVSLVGNAILAARIGEHVGQRNLAAMRMRTATFSPTRPSSTTPGCSAIREVGTHDGV